MNLNNELSFIHDNEKNKCYFDNNVISKYANVTTRTIRTYWKDFKQTHDIEKYSAKIPLVGSRKPTTFKSIEFLQYVLHRANTKNINQIQDNIKNVIDKNLSVVEGDDDMKLVLKEDYENLEIEYLDDDVQFVHDKETGKNYFSNKVIAKCTGLEESVVRKHWSNFKELNTNVQNMHVVLKVANVKQGVDFKSFDFLTYVAYRSNKPEAIQMRNYIVNAIDEKFNKDVSVIKEKRQIDNHAKRLDKLSSEIDNKKKIIKALSKQESQLYELDEEVGNKCHSRIKALSYELDKLSETQDAIYDARNASIEAEK